MCVVITKKGMLTCLILASKHVYLHNNSSWYEETHEKDTLIPERSHCHNPIGGPTQSNVPTLEGSVERVVHQDQSHNGRATQLGGNQTLAQQLCDHQDPPLP